MTIAQLARKLAQVLSAKSGEPEKVEVLTFGLQLIIGELTKYILLILLGVALDKLVIILSIAAAFGVFRVVSGGVHLSSYESCLFVTVLLITGLAYLVELLAMLPASEGLYGALALAYILLILIILFRVPVGCDNKQFHSNHVKYKVKRISLLVVTVCTVASLAVLRYHPSGPGITIVLSAMAGLLLQGFTLLPLGHRLFAALERVLDRKEVQI